MMMSRLKLLLIALTALVVACVTAVVASEEPTGSASSETLSTAPMPEHDGVVLWNMNCAGCHAKDGKGGTPAGRAKRVPDLTMPDVQARLDVEYIVGLVRQGRREPDSDKERMPSFESRLSETEIVVLARHVLTLGRSEE
jgi:cytochrome c553